MGGKNMKSESLFTWYEKLSMYFVGFVVVAFIIIMGDIKEQRERDQKIQECVQFLEETNEQD